MQTHNHLTNMHRGGWSWSTPLVPRCPQDPLKESTLGYTLNSCPSSPLLA